MKRRRMTVDQLLQEQRVDVLALPLAPASPPMRVLIDRILSPAFYPCAGGTVRRPASSTRGRAALARPVLAPQHEHPPAVAGHADDNGRDRRRPATRRRKAGVDLTILTDEDFLDDCRG